MRIRLAEATVPIVVVLLLMGLSSSSVMAQSGFTVKALLKKGDLLPDGDVFLPCKGCEARVIGQHALNNNGEVAIGADTTGSCSEGRFLISDHSFVRLADFCRETPWGRFGLLGPVNLNDSGDAAILVGIPVNGRLESALLTYVNGQFTKIVQEGDPTPAGGVFKGCGFGEPSINSKGDVAFFACAEVPAGIFPDGVSIYSAGTLSKVVVSTDPSPIGGSFNLGFVPAQTVVMNNAGEVLFQAGVDLDPATKEKRGLFLNTIMGIRKIELDGDALLGIGTVKLSTTGFGDLNNDGDVVFAVGITGSVDNGIFVWSADTTQKIMLEGEPTPLGGKFASVGGPSFTVPRINSSGTVAFKNRIKKGKASDAIFLATPRTMAKVAAVGDKLPTGGEIAKITTYALNDHGQIAFFARVKDGPDGVFISSPVPPEIESVKLKHRKGTLELRVNGSAMITNDTTIEINGTPLGDLSYPEGFREHGGITTRVVSRDPRLDQLIQQGESVEITVFNSSTNLRSTATLFSR
jgi:hypothetical protein